MKSIKSDFKKDNKKGGLQMTNLRGKQGDNTAKKNTKASAKNNGGKNMNKKNNNEKTAKRIEGIKEYIKYIGLTGTFPHLCGDKRMKDILNIDGLKIKDIKKRVGKHGTVHDYFDEALDDPIQESRYYRIYEVCIFEKSKTHEVIAAGYTPIINFAPNGKKLSDFIWTDLSEMSESVAADLDSEALSTCILCDEVWTEDSYKMPDITTEIEFNTDFDETFPDDVFI